MSKDYQRPGVRALLEAGNDPAKWRRLMARVIIATQAREGIKTTMEQALRAYDRVQRERKEKRT